MGVREGGRQGERGHREDPADVLDVSGCNRESGFAVCAPEFRGTRIHHHPTTRTPDTSWRRSCFYVWWWLCEGLLLCLTVPVRGC